MERIKDFIIRYRGAIIGGIIALLLLILKIHKILIAVLIIVAGILAGNYIQQNKEKVKDTIRKAVDRW